MVLFYKGRGPLGSGSVPIAIMLVYVTSSLSESFFCLTDQSNKVPMVGLRCIAYGSGAV